MIPWQHRPDASAGTALDQLQRRRRIWAIEGLAVFDANTKTAPTRALHQKKLSKDWR
jgi:hypothetical protein